MLVIIVLEKSEEKKDDGKIHSVINTVVAASSFVVAVATFIFTFFVK